MSPDSSNSGTTPQPRRSPRLNTALRIGILLAAVTVANLARADPFYPPEIEVRLPRSDRAELERVACGPYNLRLRDSLVTVGQSGSRDYVASLHCAPHATLYGNPVMFERTCSHATGSWTCDPETEWIFARYPGGQEVKISAKDIPLIDAYWIVSYFVFRKDFDFPRDLPASSRKRWPNFCRVEAGNEDEFRHVDEWEYRVNCEYGGERRLKRILSRAEGTLRYQEIPVRICGAHSENPSCLTGPALTVKEFLSGQGVGSHE